MSQRVIKIVLPESRGKEAQELLNAQKHLSFWQEEAADGQSVIGVLPEPGYSETITDLFERNFSSVEGFQMVLLPVEAVFPRVDLDQQKKTSADNGSQAESVAKTLRISREELYTDIAASTKVSAVYLTLVVLSTIVASVLCVRSRVEPPAP